MSYAKTSVPFSRNERPHRFVSYPSGHHLTGSCIRCGQPKDSPHHDARARPVRIRWKRLFSDLPEWNIFGGGWGN